MKKLISSLIILFTCLSSIAQSWTFKQGGNAFDGKYRTSSIQGSASEFPYEKPLFVVNVFNNDTSNVNVYLTEVPYAGCDNKKVLLKFDDDDNIFTVSVSTDKNEDTWYLKLVSESVYWDSDKNKWVDYETGEGNIKGDIFKEMKIHSKMYVRLLSDCNNYDCEFSLRGSTAALKFVLNE